MSYVQMNLGMRKREGVFVDEMFGAMRMRMRMKMGRGVYIV
jgi:hypothetical protein